MCGVAENGITMMASSDITCPICGATQCAHIKEQPADYEYFVKPARDFKIASCPGCGSQFLHPRPIVEELISFYPLDYHAYNEDHGGVAAPLVAMRAKTRAKQFRSLVERQQIRLFDVGAGDCRHFEDMSKLDDFRFTGIEIKPEMVEAARKRGYEVHQGTLEEMDIKPYLSGFDVVTMYQLLEHVIDPALVLQKALDLLVPGGYAIGQLPCLASLDAKVFGRFWAGYHFPRHLQMFTPRGLESILVKTGFNGIEVKGAIHLQAGLSLQNYLVGRWGYRPSMTYGKTPIYSFLLLAVAPFCLFEYALGKGGMMNFIARKPFTKEDDKDMKTRFE
jgi:SAM-dependent methyltransferase